MASSCADVPLRNYTHTHSLTHSLHLARGYLYNHTASLHYDQYKIILLGQTDMCVNRLPRPVITPAIIGCKPRQHPSLKAKVKVKVCTLDIAPLRESSPQKRSGTVHVHKGFHSFTGTSTCLIHNRNEPYLLLPSHL